MKNLMKFLGIIALVAIVGFSVLSCGEASEIPGTPTIPKDAPAGIDYGQPGVSAAKIDSKKYDAVTEAELETFLDSNLSNVIDEITNLIPSDLFPSIRSLITPRAARELYSDAIVFNKEQFGEYTFLNGYASYIYNDIDDENFAVSSIAQFRLDLDNGTKSDVAEQVQVQDTVTVDGKEVPLFDADGKPIYKVNADGTPVTEPKLDKDGNPIYPKVDGNLNGVATFDGKAEVSFIGEVLTIKAFKFTTGAIIAVMEDNVDTTKKGKALKVGLTASTNVNHETYKYSDFFPADTSEMTEEEMDEAIEAGITKLIDTIMGKIDLELAFYGSEDKVLASYDLADLYEMFGEELGDLL